MFSAREHPREEPREHIKLHAERTYPSGIEPSATRTRTSGRHVNDGNERSDDNIDAFRGARVRAGGDADTDHDTDTNHDTDSDKEHGNGNKNRNGNRNRKELGQGTQDGTDGQGHRPTWNRALESAMRQRSVEQDSDRTSGAGAGAGAGAGSDGVSVDAIKGG